MLVIKNFKLIRNNVRLFNGYKRLLSDHKHKQTSQTKEAVHAVLANAKYGQPTAETHPHLIDEGELVPGISVEEFKSRRLRLMNGLQKFASDNTQSENNKNHVLIVPSATKKYMSDHIPYVFRQNSDFYYLTGCLEQDSLLMLTMNEKDEMKSILFMRPKDKHSELWDGPRTGVERAVDFFGVHEAYPIDTLQSFLQREIQTTKPRIWYDTKISEQPKVTKFIEQSAACASKVPQTPATFIQSMRLFKSPAEQELMRRTCAIASCAINEVMRDARPGISEHHIFAMVDYNCRMKNASYLAYPPVVASGENATTIHYINNTQLTKSGDLVLLDAGCEYGGYTSDITRTWPISGTFTDPQRVLYEIVLTLQTELLGVLLNEGGDTLDNLFEYMCIRLAKYLQEIGLVSKCITDAEALAREGYKFCPHHVSHYLGMDVHDTPLMPRSLRLLPGMVFTIEPGIYIGNDRTDVPKEFRGIGIRIEDDVLITEKREIEVLTKSCIKSPDELENIFKAKSDD